MSGEFPGRRNSSAFGRIKDKYDGWSAWVRAATIVCPVVALVAAGLALTLTGGSGHVSSTEHASFPLATSPAVPAGPVTSTAAHRVRAAAARRRARRVTGPAQRGGIAAGRRLGGVPSGIRGNWGGQVALLPAVIESFSLNLGQSAAVGGDIGTFDIQPAGCQGNVFLAGVSGGTLVGLRMETTENPTSRCPVTLETNVHLASGGSALDYVITAASGVPGTPDNPLAQGSLYR
jgi:hypothetical protein